MARQATHRRDTRSSPKQTNDLQKFFRVSLTNNSRHRFRKPVARMRRAQNSASMLLPNRRRDAKLRFVQPNFKRPRAHDAVITAHGQETTASRSVAVDCRNDGQRVRIHVKSITATKTDQMESARDCGGRLQLQPQVL